MASYYILKCIAGDGPPHFRFETGITNGECWLLGRLFTKHDQDADFHPPQGPIPLDPRIDNKANERIYPELAWNPIPLMSKRLVSALQEAGVDNLQTYATRLTALPGVGAPSENNYLAVNIVGVVAAANLEASATSAAGPEGLISTDFHSLTVAPDKARDLLMFRLAENISAVLVHSSVRESVERAGITTLTWYEPESWAG